MIKIRNGNWVIECDAPDEAVEVLERIGRAMGDNYTRQEIKVVRPPKTLNGTGAVATGPKGTLCEACHTSRLRKNSVTCPSCSKTVCSKCRDTMDRSLCNECGGKPQ